MSADLKSTPLGLREIATFFSVPTDQHVGLTDLYAGGSFVPAGTVNGAAAPIPSSGVLSVLTFLGAQVPLASEAGWDFFHRFTRTFYRDNFGEIGSADTNFYENGKNPSWELAGPGGAGDYSAAANQPWRIWHDDRFVNVQCSFFEGIGGSPVWNYADTCPDVLGFTVVLVTSGQINSTADVTLQGATDASTLPGWSRKEQYQGKIAIKLTDGSEAAPIKRTRARLTAANAPYEYIVTTASYAGSWRNIATALYGWEHKSPNEDARDVRNATAFILPGYFQASNVNFNLLGATAQVTTLQPGDAYVYAGHSTRKNGIGVPVTPTLENGQAQRFRRVVSYIQSNNTPEFYNATAAVCAHTSPAGAQPTPGDIGVSAGGADTLGFAIKLSPFDPGNLANRVNARGVFDVDGIGNLILDSRTPKVYDGRNDSVSFRMQADGTASILHYDAPPSNPIAGGIARILFGSLLSGNVGELCPRWYVGDPRSPQTSTWVRFRHVSGAIPSVGAVDTFQNLTVADVLDIGLVHSGTPTDYKVSVVEVDVGFKDDVGGPITNIQTVARLHMRTCNDRTGSVPPVSGVNMDGKTLLGRVDLPVWTNGQYDITLGGAGIEWATHFILVGSGGKINVYDGNNRALTTLNAPGSPIWHSRVWMGPENMSSAENAPQVQFSAKYLSDLRLSAGAGPFYNGLLTGANYRHTERSAVWNADGSLSLWSFVWADDPDSGPDNCWGARVTLTAAQIQALANQAQVAMEPANAGQMPGYPAPPPPPPPPSGGGGGAGGGETPTPGGGQVLD